MKSIFSSYNTKILGLMLAVSLIPIAAISVYLYTTMISTESGFLEDELSSFSYLGAHSVSDWFERKTNFVETLGKNHQILLNTKILLDDEATKVEKFEAKFSLESQINDAFQNNLWIEDLFICDKNGGILFYTGISPPSLEKFTKKHFQDALEGKVGISELELSSDYIKNENGNFESEIPTLLISSPIKGDVGIEGVITARLKTFGINSEQENILTEFVSSDSYIVNSDGYMVSKPGFSKLAYEMNLFEKRPELDLQIIDPDSQSFTKIFQMSNEGKTVSDLSGYNNYFGNNVIGAISPIPKTDWFYIVEVDQDEAFVEIIYVQNILITSISLILLGIFGSSLYFSTSLAKPIKDLKDVSEQITEGNLAIKVPIKGKDELHDLAVSFNSMVKSLKHSMDLLTDAEEKYRNLYEGAPTLNRTINTDGIIVDCNSQYAKRLGYTKKEIIGHTLFEHTPKNKLPEIMESFETWKRTGGVRNREISLQTKNGEIFPCILSANSLYNKNGELIGSNTIIKDISELRSIEKRAIEAEERVKNEKLTAIGELSSRIAHELRNPLNVVKTGIYLLKPQLEKDNESNKERIEIINRALDRMTFQLNDVMDYIRNKPLVLQEINLSKLIQSSIERANIPTKVDVKIPTESTLVKADYDKLETVFSNLILNASQAIKNSGKINVRVLNGKMKNENVIIEVEDSGPGIPNENLDKIFDPLFTTKQNGSGLGLAACKNIIELHKGKISVQNNPTTFRIELPRQKN